MKGSFIVFEGMDGTGKTTQAVLVYEWLKSLGKEVILTREPGGCSISEQIRDVILAKENIEMNDITETMLYASARAQHVAQIIKPAIDAGKIVISDRFIHSSIAYQGVARNLGKETIIDINKHALFGIWPDATIFFDLKQEDCRFHENKDRIELMGEEFFAKVLSGYKSMYNDKDCFVIDASLKIEVIFNKIKGILEGVIK